MTPRTSLPQSDPRWAYFLDFDGTLVPLAGSPDRVRVDARLSRLVAELHAATGGAVAFITGRPIAEVDRLFGGLVLPTAGQHGLERRTATGRLIRHAPARDRLDTARRHLAGVVARYPALLLEDKGLSLALHYRRAPRLAGYVHRLVQAERARLGTSYGLRAGKRVVEIAPTGKDKGQAIAAFMAESPFRGRTPVFLGDDVTDEAGFGMVNRLGGLSIKVGQGRTVATWRLRDVPAVRAWLKGSGRPR